MSTVPAAASGEFKLAGKTPVRRMGFGAMRITGPGIWGEPADRDNAKRVLRRVIELGVNLIDTANSYGPETSENLIAEALHPYPSDLIIATKAGLTRQGPEKWAPVGRPEYLRQCCELSLRRLKIDTIDLYQLHRIDSKVPAEDQFGLLQDLQNEGKVRYIGLSEVSVDEMKAAGKFFDVVSVQIYNLGNRQSEAVLEYSEDNGIGFIPWFPVGGGDLLKPGGPLETAAAKKDATVAQVSLAWLLKRSPVMLPIPGTSSIAHLEENIAASAIELSGAEFDELSKLGAS